MKVFEEKDNLRRVELTVCLAEHSNTATTDVFYRENEIVFEGKPSPGISLPERCILEQVSFYNHIWSRRDYDLIIF